MFHVVPFECTIDKRFRMVEAMQILLQRRSRQNIDLHNRRKLYISK